MTTNWRRACARTRLAGWVCALGLLASASIPGCSVAAGVGPTVKDLVEFTHLVFDLGIDDQDALQQQVSADGRRAVIVTRRGNVRTDRNRFEILQLDIDPVRLRAGRRASPKLLFAVESSVDQTIFEPSIDQVRWLGNTAIVFRARVNDAPYQVYAIDIGSRRLQQLTFSDRAVHSFAISQDRKRIAYSVRVPAPVAAPGARGIVVENKTQLSVLFSRSNPEFEDLRYQVLASRTVRGARPRALGEPFTIGEHAPRISMSPDGHWASFKMPEPDETRLRRWIDSYPDINEVARRVGSLEHDPLRYFSTYLAVHPKRVVVARVDDGSTRFVLDAPESEFYSMTRRDQLWLPGSRHAEDGSAASLIIGGTYLPLVTAEAKAVETRAHVVEYFPESGRWTAITQVAGELKGIYGVPGDPASFVMVDGDGHRMFRRTAPGQWTTSSTGPGGEQATNLEWSLRIQQSLDTPPDIFASTATGRSVRLTDLNPQFAAPAWGEVRGFQWTDSRQRQWNGGLILPASYQRGVRYPLVIQTYGFDRAAFYLDGPNTFTTFTSAFPGRAFAREGILVLAMDTRPATDEQPSRTRARDALFMFREGVAGAIASLVEQGLVDRERIGIIGFSGTARDIEDLLAFTDSPIRAATLADGLSKSIYSLTLGFGLGYQHIQTITTELDARPFGDSTQQWASRVPTHNLHCVTAAVRIEAYGTYVHGFWDTYALLRYQYKPAEMIVIPHGQHNLSRPSERMISLQGNVDWYRFWLKGEERDEVVVPGETAQSLKDQYQRWHRMSRLMADDAKRLPCPPERAGK